MAIKQQRNIRKKRVGSLQAREELLLEAVLAYQANDLDKAERLCRRLILRAAHYSPAKLLLGMIAGRTGRSTLGIRTLREAIALDANYLEPRIELAGLLNAEGENAAAIALCEESLAYWPDSGALYNMLGLALLSDGSGEAAIGTLQRATALAPNLAIVHHNLGMALQIMGRDREAIEAYRRAISQSPDNVEAHAQLAHLLFAHGRRDDARECLRKGSRARPGSSACLLLEAELVLGEGDLGAAERIVQRIIASEPGLAPAHHLLAIIHQQSGHFAEAHASYEQTIVLSPQRTSALVGLAMSGKFTVADRPLLNRLEAHLNSGNLPETSRVDIHYALGKASDDLGDFAQAIRHFDAANELLAERIDRAAMTFNQAEHRASIEQMIHTFSADFFSTHERLGHNSDLPVLIVGMPRSGTTLVEQIISSHPAIGGAGEQHFWPDHASLLGSVMADSVSSSHLDRLAEEYCATLRGLAPSARHVTDKMPANFLLLGLIHLVLPNARILHVRRNAVDTCLSIYFTPFSNLVNFAYRRDDIVAYYREYQRLMAHWRRILPRDRFLEIDYEQLVGDHELVARRMITFCGLEWDEACLRHENNPHPIHTPSWWQARQPVYRTSVERWRRYEPWLGEFNALLTRSSADAPPRSL